MGKCMFCEEKLYFGKKNGFHYRCKLISEAIKEFGFKRTLILIARC